jgi:hypothetical protein
MSSGCPPKLTSPSNYVYCCCRTNDSYDLSLLGQPFRVEVEYVNTTLSKAYVHLHVASQGDQVAVEVPAAASVSNPATGAELFYLRYPFDTTGERMQARLRDTVDPDPGVGTTLATEAEQVNITMLGIGM